jgi:hypothetical protein
MSSLNDILSAYLATTKDLQVSFGDMSREQLLARPIEGKWSSLEVLCHLVDTDLLMAMRIRAALASERPRQLGLTTEQLMGMVAWESRDAAEEVALFVALRSQTARMIRGFIEDPSDRELVIIKPDGTEVIRTVRQILQGVTSHAPGHLAHVREKRRRLGLSTDYAIHGTDA